MSFVSFKKKGIVTQLAEFVLLLQHELAVRSDTKVMSCAGKWDMTDPKIVKKEDQFHNQSISEESLCCHLA